MVSINEILVQGKSFHIAQHNRPRNFQYCDYPYNIRSVLTKNENKSQLNMQNSKTRIYKIEFAILLFKNISC
jgi:hypothetical protein